MRYDSGMRQPTGQKRIDLERVTLAWGQPAAWKAQLRQESHQRHLERPIGVRLAAALALLLPRAGVVTPEDLLIHKMIKLRTDRRRLLQDLADIRAVAESQVDRLDWSYVRNWLPAEESAWLEDAARLDEETLVRRLLDRSRD